MLVCIPFMLVQMVRLDALFLECIRTTRLTILQPHLLERLALLVPLAQSKSAAVPQRARQAFRNTGRGRPAKLRTKSAEPAGRARSRSGGSDAEASSRRVREEDISLMLDPGSVMVPLAAPA